MAALTSSELKTSFDRWLSEDKSVEGFQKLALSLKQNQPRLRALRRLLGKASDKTNLTAAAAQPPILILLANLREAGLLPDAQETRALERFLRFAAPMLVKALRRSPEEIVLKPGIDARILSIFSNELFRKHFGKQTEAHLREYFEGFIIRLENNPATTAAAFRQGEKAILAERTRAIDFLRGIPVPEKKLSEAPFKRVSPPLAHSAAPLSRKQQTIR